MIDCNKCKWITVNEEVQNLVKEKNGVILSHICDLYEEKLLHTKKNKDYHPKIIPCEYCNRDYNKFYIKKKKGN